MTYWYYIKHGQQNGPVDEDALKGLFATGNIVPDTMVWRKDLTEWTRACDVDGLVPADFRPPPLPSQPPPWPPRIPASGVAGKAGPSPLSVVEGSASQAVFPPPQIALAGPVPETIILPSIQKKITTAWMAGVLSGSVTLVLAILAISGKSLYGFSGWSLLDAVVAFGLSFGIYRRSRTCAVLMLVNFLIAQYISISSGTHPGGLAILVGIIWVFVFFRGSVGTFQYHQALRSQNGHS